MKIASFFFLVFFVITSPASAQSRKPSSIAELAVYRGPDREQILYAGAKAEGKIIWYTSLAGDSYKEMVKAFETRYSGVKVESYRAAGAELVARRGTRQVRRDRPVIADAPDARVEDRRGDDGRPVGGERGTLYDPRVRKGWPLGPSGAHVPQAEQEVRAASEDRCPVRIERDRRNGRAVIEQAAGRGAGSAVDEPGVVTVAHHEGRAVRAERRGM